MIPSLPQWVYQGASLGGTGVHLFFFCSGFGLYLSYQKKQPGYFEFIRTRLLRIYIPYIIVVLLYFFIPLIKYNGDRFGALCSHLLLYKMFIPKYEESFGGFFWFISTIIQFYIVFIPLCKIKEKTGNIWFGIGGFAISLIWWIIMAISGLHYERIWGCFFFQYLWEFCLGMIVADILYHKDSVKISNSHLLIIAIIGIGFLGITGIYGGWAVSLNDIPSLFGYGALTLLLFQIKPIAKIGTWIGEISYEWYLLHVLLFKLAFAVEQGWKGALLGFASSIICAYFYHQIILSFRGFRHRINKRN